MTNQGNTTNRPLLWDDDPPASIRMRRNREETAPAGRVRPTAAGRRGAPGMPPEFDDPDGEDGFRSRDDRDRSPWWRPQSTAGRVFLALGAVLVLGSFTTAGILLKQYLDRDSRFRIGGSPNIQATGLLEVSRAEMLPVFGEDIGRNVFFVPLDERRKELEQIPWIEHATVMRLLPDQIRVAVVERRPVAFTRRGAEIGLVDADGVLLDMPPRTMTERHYSFPVVTGIDPRDSGPARKERMAVYLHLMQDLDAGGRHNSEEISEIDLTDPEDARVTMPEQGGDVIAHFGDDKFLERFERYKAHIAEWRQQYPHLRSVDLTLNDQVVLEMASGKEAAQASAGADSGVPAAGSDAPSADARSSSDAKPAPGTPAASPTSGTKKSKPAQDKKHAAAKHTTAMNQGTRNPGSPSHATQSHAAQSHAPQPHAAHTAATQAPAAAQGG